jgi:hypothetical protein
MVPQITVSGLTGATTTGGRFASYKVATPVSDAVLMGSPVIMKMVFAVHANLALAWRRDLEKPQAAHALCSNHSGLGTHPSLTAQVCAG